MAHAFVVGGAASDSERDIRVGGVDAVPAGVFGGVDYVALGHLHGPQADRVPGGRRGSAGVRTAPRGRPGAPVLRVAAGLLVLRDAPPQVDGAGRPRRRTVSSGRRARPGARPAAAVGGHRHARRAARAGRRRRTPSDWLRVVVTDAARPPDLHARLKSRFPHVLRHRAPPAGRSPARRRRAVVTAARDPVEVAAEFVEHVTGAAPTADELAVLRRAYEDVLGRRTGAPDAPAPPHLPGARAVPRASTRSTSPRSARPGSSCSRGRRARASRRSSTRSSSRCTARSPRRTRARTGCGPATRRPSDETFVDLVFETGSGVFRVRRTPAYERPKQRGDGHDARSRPTVKLWRLTSPDAPDDGELHRVPPRRGRGRAPARHRAGPRRSSCRPSSCRRASSRASCARNPEDRRGAAAEGLRHRGLRAGRAAARRACAPRRSARSRRRRAEVGRAVGALPRCARPAPTTRGTLREAGGRRRGPPTSRPGGRGGAPTASARRRPPTPRRRGRGQRRAPTPCGSLDDAACDGPGPSARDALLRRARPAGRGWPRHAADVDVGRLARARARRVCPRSRAPPRPRRRGEAVAARTPRAAPGRSRGRPGPGGPGRRDHRGRRAAQDPGRRARRCTVARRARLDRALELEAGLADRGTVAVGDLDRAAGAPCGPAGRAGRPDRAGGRASAPSWRSDGTRCAARGETPWAAQATLGGAEAGARPRSPCAEARAAAPPTAEAVAAAAARGRGVAGGRAWRRCSRRGSRGSRRARASA